MVCASNGGAVAAALAAVADGVAGSLSSGLHHARRGHGAGFCTFNGLALAVHAARAAGARSILILDLDAHCGGGTHSLVAKDPSVWQLDVAVSPFDSYAATERTTLDLVRDASRYLPTVESRLQELEVGAPRFDLCLYNAGMDPFEGCDIGGLRAINRAILGERERLVFDWSRRRRIPIAFVLAGGYLGAGIDQSGLVGLHRLTLSAAVRARTS
jgi:acetoin utilization deacetylase AcuC-like enzyme